jgi:hypothetical protein
MMWYVYNNVGLVNTIFENLLVASLTVQYMYGQGPKCVDVNEDLFCPHLFWRKHTRLHVLLNIDLKGHSHEIEVTRTEAHVRAGILPVCF